MATETGVEISIPRRTETVTGSSIRHATSRRATKRKKCLFIKRFILEGFRQWGYSPEGQKTRTIGPMILGPGWFYGEESAKGLLNNDEFASFALAAVVDDIEVDGAGNTLPV